MSAEIIISPILSPILLESRIKYLESLKTLPDQLIINFGDTYVLDPVIEEISRRTNLSLPLVRMLLPHDLEAVIINKENNKY